MRQGIAEALPGISSTVRQHSGLSVTCWHQARPQGTNVGHARCQTSPKGACAVVQPEQTGAGAFQNVQGARFRVACPRLPVPVHGELGDGVFLCMVSWATAEPHPAPWRPVSPPALNLDLERV